MRFGSVSEVHRDRTKREQLTKATGQALRQPSREQGDDAPILGRRVAAHDLADPRLDQTQRIAEDAS